MVNFMVFIFYHKFFKLKKCFESLTSSNGWVGYFGLTILPRTTRKVGFKILHIYSTWKHQRVTKTGRTFRFKIWKKEAEASKMYIYGATFPLKLTTNSESEHGGWEPEKQDRTFKSLTYMKGKKEVHGPSSGE